MVVDYLPRDPAALKHWIDSKQLKGHPVNVVLETGDYQVLQTDIPAVADNEVQDALRWRLQDRLNQPAEETVLDYFGLPEDAYHGRQKVIYAVAMAKDRADEIAAEISVAGLKLQALDIPELVLKNLNDQIDQQPSSAKAWVHLGHHHSIINIYAEQALYMTRRVDLQGNADPSQAVLEIRRSLDYFQSQIGRTPCVKLWISPLQSGETPFIQQAKMDLGIEVEQLDLADWFHSESSLAPALQQQTLLAIAGCLREAGK